MSTRLPPELVVLMHGAPVASLRRHPRTKALPLEYCAGLPAGPPPLSVSMPLAATTHAGPVVANWVQGLLPDRVDEITGSGALDPLTEQDIAERLVGLATEASGWGIRVGAGEFSLAGSQARLALHHGPGGWAVPTGAMPTTHIIKPAIAALPDQDINEHLTMRTASLVGLRVPTTSVVRFAGQRALVVERYDRARIGDEWYRVHQEDACQALGMSPARRYEADGGPGPADIVGLLRREVAGPDYGGDALLFLEALGFNWLVGGTDAHAKNYSVLHGGNGHVRLAPLYDIASALPYGRLHEQRLALAMKVGDKYRVHRIGRHEWQKLAADVHLSADETIGRIADLASRVVDSIATVRDRAVSRGLTHPIVPRLAEALARRAHLCLQLLRA